MFSVQVNTQCTAKADGNVFCFPGQVLDKLKFQPEHGEHFIAIHPTVVRIDYKKKLNAKN